MSNDAYTHYVVLNETILGEARIIEKCNEWISLAFVKLGVGSSKPFNDYAFVWEQGSLRYYLNGHLVQEVTDPSKIPSNPQKVFFSLWGSDTMPGWMGS